jgi:hypothetical protein
VIEFCSSHYVLSSACLVKDSCSINCLEYTSSPASLKSRRRQRTRGTSILRVRLMHEHTPRRHSIHGGSILSLPPERALPRQRHPSAYNLASFQTTHRHVSQAVRLRSRLRGPDSAQPSEISIQEMKAGGEANNNDYGSLHAAPLRDCGRVERDLGLML